MADKVLNEFIRQEKPATLPAPTVVNSPNISDFTFTPIKTNTAPAAQTAPAGQPDLSAFIKPDKNTPAPATVEDDGPTGKLTLVDKIADWFTSPNISDIEMNIINPTALIKDPDLRERIEMAPITWPGKSFREYVENSRKIQKQIDEDKERRGIITKEDDEFQTEFGKTGDFKKFKWSEAYARFGRNLELAASLPKLLIGKTGEYLINEIAAPANLRKAISEAKKAGDLKQIAELQEELNGRGSKHLKDILKLVKEGIKYTARSFAHPVKSFYEDPLFTALDWGGLYDVANIGVKAAAKGYKTIRKGANAGEISPILDQNKYMGKPSDIMASTTDVKTVKDIKRAAEFKGYDPAFTQQELIEKFYKKENYAYLSKSKPDELVYIVMPSSKGSKNITADLLADQLVKDYGGKKIDIATAAYDKPGAKASTLEKIAQDPRRFITKNLSQTADIQGKTVVIVDDIIETGETVEGLAKTLQRVGVKSDKAAALAAPRIKYVKVKQLEDLADELAGKAGIKQDEARAVVKNALGNSLEEKITKIQNELAAVEAGDKAVDIWKSIQNRSNELSDINKTYRIRARTSTEDEVLRSGLTVDEQAAFETREKMRKLGIFNLDRKDYTGLKTLEAAGDNYASIARTAPEVGKEQLEKAGAIVVDYKFMEQTIDDISNNKTPDAIRIIYNVDDAKKLQGLTAPGGDMHGIPVEVWATDGTTTVKTVRTTQPGAYTYVKTENLGIDFYNTMLADAMEKNMVIGENAMEGLQPNLKKNIEIHNDMIERQRAEYEYIPPADFKQIVEDARIYKTFEEYEKEGLKIWHGSKASDLEHLAEVQHGKQITAPSIGISKATDNPEDWGATGAIFMVPKEILTRKTTPIFTADMWSVRMGRTPTENIRIWDTKSSAFKDVEKILKDEIEKSSKYDKDSKYYTPEKMYNDELFEIIKDTEVEADANGNLTIIKQTGNIKLGYFFKNIYYENPKQLEKLAKKYGIQMELKKGEAYPSNLPELAKKIFEEATVRLPETATGRAKYLEEVYLKNNKIKSQQGDAGRAYAARKINPEDIEANAHILTKPMPVTVKNLIEHIIELDKKLDVWEDTNTIIENTIKTIPDELKTDFKNFTGKEISKENLKKVFDFYRYGDQGLTLIQEAVKKAAPLLGLEKHELTGMERYLAQKIAGADDTAAIREIFDYYRLTTQADLSDATLLEAQKILREAYTDTPKVYFEAKSFQAHSVNEFPAVIVKNTDVIKTLNKLNYTGKIFNSYKDFYSYITKLKKKPGFLETLDRLADETLYPKPEFVKINNEVTMPVLPDKHPLTRPIKSWLLQSQNPIGKVYRELNGLTEGSSTARFIQKHNSRHLIARQQIMGEMVSYLKALTKKELDLFVPFIEGRVALTLKEIERSPALFYAVKKWEKLADEGAIMAKINPKDAERRAYLMFINREAAKFEAGSNSVIHQLYEYFKKENVKKSKGKGLDPFPGYSATDWKKYQAAYWGNMAEELGMGGITREVMGEGSSGVGGTVYKKNIAEEQKTGLLRSELEARLDDFKKHVDYLMKNPGAPEQATAIKDMGQMLYEIDKYASFDAAPRNKLYLEEAINYADNKMGVGAKARKGLSPDATIDEVKALYAQRVQEAAAQGLYMIEKPVYFPHVFKKQELTASGRLKSLGGLMRGQTFGDFLVNYMNRKKPGFLKRAFGKEGYSEDVIRVLPEHLAKVVGYKNTEEFFDMITNTYALKLRPGEPLKHGYVAWHPDGFLKIYKETIKLDDEILRVAGLKGDPEIIEDINRIIQKLNMDFELQRLGVSKDAGFQIPATVMQTIKEQTAPAPKSIRALYDPGINAWRHTVLYMRPAWVTYNAVGNEVFMTLAGVMPTDRLHALQEKWLATVPPEVKGMNMAFEQAFGTGKMGTAIDWQIAGIPLGKYSSDVQEAVRQIWRNDLPSVKEIFKMANNPEKLRKVIEKTAAGAVMPLRTFEDLVQAVNEIVETHARAATYFKVSPAILKEHLYSMGYAGEQAFKAMTDLEKQKYVTNNSILKNRAIDKVNYFLNDYMKKSQLERLLLRRLFPFISFSKHVFTLFFRYGIDHPKTAWALATIARIQDEYQADILAEAGLFEQLENNNLMPFYMRGPGTFEIKNNALKEALGINKGTQLAFFPGYMNPAQSIANMGKAMKEGRGMGVAVNEAGLGLPSSPIMQTWIAATTGEDPFTGEKYTKPGESKGNKLINNGQDIGIIGKEAAPPIHELLLRAFPQYPLYYKLYGTDAPLYTGEPLYKQSIRGTKFYISGQKGKKNRKLPLLRYMTGAPLYEYNSGKEQINTLQTIQREYPKLLQQQILDEIAAEKAAKELRKRGGK